MALQNAPRVGIHNKDRVIPCIEQDGIGGFGADAVHIQELRSQFCGRSAKHHRKGAAMLFSEKLYECLELSGFLAEVARGADEAGEFRLGHLFKGRGCKQFRPAQIGNGTRSVHPVGVLNQDRADDYLKGRSTRPPVLFAVHLKQCVEVLPQDRQALWERRSASVAAGFADWRGCVVRCGQSGGRTHLFRTITTPCGQVKNATLR